ncbi:MFS transporter [Paracraurococcus ruber]|uniref:MFS transporter n=1 Tax=Paracraurococcus ruber TaxID=77675 RepID=A0ABS1CVB5_9PROT|nr:MFS transporter [Paracraurococcus ruber]MBK1658246.1 MFS transporter [Paracraurococcus ruber]TDG30710.1 MFS transporter [Paracraurococcus ruber]
MARLGALGRALSHRDARLFFAASLVSWTGLWVHRIAVSWLAWEMTRSAFWVGMVAFCDLAPAVLFSPIAGAVADRMDRVRLCMVSQGAIAVQAALVAGLLAAGELTIGLLLALEVMSGIAASFSQPARQSLMPGLVPRADLPAAVACNSLCFNVARFIGPGLAGPIIATGGVVPAIALNSLAYVIATLTMPLLRVEASQRRGHAPEGSVWAEAAAGFRYAGQHPGIGPLLAFAAIAAILMRGVQEILPPFVERIFLRGPDGLALLTACIGIGALFSGLWVASRGRMEGATRLAIGAVGVQAVATIGFVATGAFPFALLCAAAMGAAGSVHGISTQTLVQNAADPAMRGRVLSLWGLITRACPALGALALGGLGEVFGLRLPTILAMLLALLVLGWGLHRLPRMARVLEDRGEAPVAAR